MSHLPLANILFFLFTTILAWLAFAKAVRGSKRAMALSLAWISLQSMLGVFGFYKVTHTSPPRLALAMLPPLFLIAFLFLSRAGRQSLDAMDLRWCVLLHSIRILVELNLFWLFLYKQVPAIMTFEGGNLDIFAGLTAPLIWWVYSKGKIGKRGLLIWNSLALLGVLNAFVRAVLSAPTRFQRLAFDQPTVAILTFPFVLLPAFIVPAVLLCHFVVFRKMFAVRS